MVDGTKTPGMLLLKVYKPLVVTLKAKYILTKEFVKRIDS